MKLNIPNVDNLTFQMKNLVNFPLDNNHLLVIGSPGTWKSVIAIHRTKLLINSKKKVVLLCYNVLLNQLLSKEIENYNCSTIDSFYWSIRYEVDNKISNSKRITDSNIDITEVEEYFKKYIKLYWKYDAIIIDEAQDLSANILNSLKILTDHLTIFCDPNQPLSDPCSNIEEIKIYFSNIYTEILEKNFRNTKQIYQFAAERFMRWDEIANNKNLVSLCESDPNSTPIIYEKIRNFDQQTNIIMDIINKNKNNSIWVFFSNVSFIDSFSSILYKNNILHSIYYNKLWKVELNKLILLTTYKSAKGLEFDICIILIDESVMREEKLNQKLFVLSTRAKKKLYFIFSI